MNQWLEALTASDFGQWVLTSEWGYPILLTFHSFGLALVVGLMIVLDMRVLGIGRGIPLPAFNSLMRVVWIGFFANAVSGAAIFTSDALKYYYSTTFRVKLTGIAIGLILLSMIRSSVLAADPTGRIDDNVPSRAKLFAVMSLVSWIGALVAGRLMAYTD